MFTLSVYTFFIHFVLSSKFFFFTPYCIQKSSNVICGRHLFYSYFFFSYLSVEYLCIIFKSEVQVIKFYAFLISLHSLDFKLLSLFYCFLNPCYIFFFNLYFLFTFYVFFPFIFALLSNSLSIDSAPRRSSITFCIICFHDGFFFTFFFSF